MLLREPAWRPTSNMDSSAENNLAVKHKTVKFYKNGDRFFRGHQVSITDRRYRSFDNLLSELTRVTKLPHGVRFVFSPQTGRRVHNLEELENGKSYVCASNGRLTKMDYGGSSIKLSDSNSSKDAAFSRKAKMNVRLKPLNHVETNHKSTKNSSSITVSKALVIKPRLITVIRNGHKPRQVVKILLNRRTAQSFEQVLDDITSSVGVEGGSGVRKLYSSDGKPVQGLSDLLNNEAEVFIAVGREKFNVQDISDILKDGNLHSDRGKVKNRTKKVDLDSSISIRTKNYENKNNHEETVDDIVSPKSKEDRLKTDNKLAKRLGIVHRRGSKGETVSKQTPSSKKVHLPALHGEVNNVSTKTEDLNSATVLPSIIKNDSNSDKIDDTVRPTEPPVSNQLPDIPGSPEDFDSLKDLKDDIKDVYDFGKKLGDGNFAVVREVTHKMNRKHYALKIIDRSKIRGKEAMLENEIRIMKQCKHSNIVKLYDDLHSSNEIFLVMELVSGGDLFDAISSAIRFAEPVAANCLHDICSALGYLHKQNIVHRDLKPENVLVCDMPSRKLMKLADFGLAMEVREPIYTVCGTPTYVAPEILKESGYGLSVDMWAAGVITYIMLCGFPPFRSAKRRQSELFDLIETGKFEFLSPYWDEVSEEAKDLVSKLLVVKVSERYRAENVLKHIWTTTNATPGVDESLNLDPSLSQRRPSKFKSAAITIQSVNRLKMLASNFNENRGEKILTHIR